MSNFSNHPSPWTPERRERFIAQRLAGVSRKDMAAEFGVSPDSIDRMASRLRMLKHIDLYDWTPKREAEVRRLVEAGWSAGKIAKAWGVTRGVISGRLRKLGVKSSGPRFAVEKRVVLPEVPVVRKPVVAPPPAVVPAPVVRSDGGGCQWPMWGHQERVPRPPVFCGAAVVAGAYCASHRRSAYVRVGSGLDAAA